MNDELRKIVDEIIKEKSDEEATAILRSLVLYAEILRNQ